MQWKEIVQEYIIKYSDKIKRATKPLREHFGVKYFTYHSIDKLGNYTVLVDRPDWAEHYVNEKLYLQDPYLRNQSVYTSGITLIANHGSKEYRDSVSKTSKAILEVDVAPMLIQKNVDSVDIFGFAGNSKSSFLISLYLNHPEILCSFGTYFKKEMHSILYQMQQECCNLRKLKGTDYDLQEPIYCQVASTCSKAFYKDIGEYRKIERANTLSRRERECLKLQLRGMTAKETAFSLHLSVRTVEHYFENIKNKLECSCKKEVLELAKELNTMGLL